MQLITVKIEKPNDTNFILGQTHFIKSVEDIHEALIGAVPGIKFGLAFCEASGKCLVRWSGTDPGMTELAKKNASAIGAGHSFIVFLGDGFYPLNIVQRHGKDGRSPGRVLTIECALNWNGDAIGNPDHASRPSPVLQGDRTSAISTAHRRPTAARE
jgi:adenosine/AMP kinase